MFETIFSYIFASMTFQAIGLVVGILIVVIVLISARRKKHPKKQPPVLFIGDRITHVYHCPGCEIITHANPAHYIPFYRSKEPGRAGYTPCSECNPK